MNKKILVAFIAGATSIAGYAVAQQTQTDEEFMADMKKRDDEQYKDDQKLRKIYDDLAQVEVKTKSQSVGNSTMLKSELASTLRNLKFDQSKSRTAWQSTEAATTTTAKLLVLQVLQNQKIIEQNAQIIKLLGDKK